MLRQGCQLILSSWLLLIRIFKIKILLIKVIVIIKQGMEFCHLKY